MEIRLSDKKSGTAFKAISQPWYLIAIFTIVVILFTTAGWFTYLKLTNPYQAHSVLVFTADGVKVKDDFPALQQECRPFAVDTMCAKDHILAIDGKKVEEWVQSLFYVSNLPRTSSQFNTIVTYTVMRGNTQQQLAVKYSIYPIRNLWSEYGSILFFLLVSQSITVVILWLRPNDLAARTLFLGASSFTAYEVCWMLNLNVSDFLNGTSFWLYYFTLFVGWTLFYCGGLHFTLVFSKSPEFLKRNNWLVWLFYLAPFVTQLLFMAIVFIFTSTITNWIANWLKIYQILTVAYFGVILYTVVNGYINATYTTSKQGIRVLAVAFGMPLAISLFFEFIPALIFGKPSFDWRWQVIYCMPMPFAVAYAVLRHQAFGIANRALVYITLSGGSVVFYLSTVAILNTLLRPLLDGLMHTLFDNQNSSFTELFIQYFSIALLALWMQPVHARLQHLVDRLIYGSGRENPYKTLSSLNLLVEGAFLDETVLRTVVKTVSESLKLPYVAIALKGPGGEFRVKDSYGTANGEFLPALSLKYKGEVVGQLLMQPRSPGETLTRLDHQLLEALSPHVGNAVNAIFLSTDLREARENITLAREEELERHVRFLHDEVATELAGMTLNFDAAFNLSKIDPGKAHDLLKQLKSQTQELITNIRDEIAGQNSFEVLFQSGLVVTLNQLIESRYSKEYNPNLPRIGVKATPSRLPRLPRAVELAAYRVIMEALANVVRHAQARNCFVYINLSEWSRKQSQDDTPGTQSQSCVNVVFHRLLVRIVDDGVGLAPNYKSGNGLTIMRNRVEELGGEFALSSELRTGGTQVVIDLPL